MNAFDLDFVAPADLGARIIAPRAFETMGLSKRAIKVRLAIAPSHHYGDFSDT